MKKNQVMIKNFVSIFKIQSANTNINLQQMSHFNILLVLALLLSVGLTAIPIIVPGIYLSAEEYLTLFGKNYQESQKAQRKALYQTEVERVKQFNIHSNSEKQTINNYSDWTQAEKSKLSGNQASFSESSGFENANQLRAKLQSAGDNKLKSAASLDWRLLGAVTSIKDQGSCGACWAFATIAQAESHLIVRNKATNSIGFSEQFTLRCTTGSGCNGGYLQDASNLIISKGCPYRSEFPYNPASSSTSVCNGASSYMKVAQKASFYYGLSDTEIINLLQTSPLAIAVSSHEWTGYSTGIKTCTSASVLDHAVQLVGYDTTHWIVKNQWGQAWGQSGYIHINRDRTNSYTNCFVGRIIVQFEGDPSGETYYLFTIVILLMIFMFI